MKTKIDPETGKTLYKVQPKGRPALWLNLELCDRCKPHNKCYGFKSLSENEWLAIESNIEVLLIEKTEKELFEEYNLHSC